MTAIFLLDDLKAFIEENTADILLEARVRAGSPAEKERAAEVHVMALPEKDDSAQQAPYILLKPLTGTDEKEAGQPKKSEARVRIIIVAYATDAQQGQLALMNLILRIRERLQKQHIIGGRFCLEYPFEYIIYQDTTPPYYMGEIMTLWSVPTIEREVQELWQQ